VHSREIQLHPGEISLECAKPRNHLVKLLIMLILLAADRALFVAKVRAALAESVARGDPLPPVRLRERTKARTPDPREREPEPTRG